MNALDKYYIAASCRMHKVKESFEEFWKNQSGVSNVVATIILLLVVVLLIGAFWGQLKDWAQKLMTDVFSENSKPTDTGLEKGSGM